MLTNILEQKSGAKAWKTGVPGVFGPKLRDFLSKTLDLQPANSGLSPAKQWTFSLKTVAFYPLTRQVTGENLWDFRTYLLERGRKPGCNAGQRTDAGYGKSLFALFLSAFPGYRLAFVQKRSAGREEEKYASPFRSHAVFRYLCPRECNRRT